jgi:hypothetical protein
VNLNDMIKEIDNSYNRDNVDNTMRTVYTKGFRAGVKWLLAWQAVEGEKTPSNKKDKK